MLLQFAVNLATDRKFTALPLKRLASGTLPPAWKPAV